MKNHEKPNPTQIMIITVDDFSMLFYLFGASG
jgi:hypothetical protein